MALKSKDIQCDFVRAGVINCSAVVSTSTTGGTVSIGPMSASSLTATTLAVTGTSAFTGAATFGANVVATSLSVVGTSAYTGLATFSGGIHSTTVATGAGDVLSWADVYPATATTISGRWEMVGDSTIAAAQVLELNRIGRIVTIVPSAAATEIASTGAETSLTYSVAVPAGFTATGTTGTTILAPVRITYDSVPETAYMQISGTRLSIIRNGTNVISAGGDVIPSNNFCFIFRI